MAITRELGISRNAVRVKLGNTVPGDDECYSMSQVSTALNEDSNNGPLYQAKLKTEEQRGKLLELKVDRFKGSLVHMDDMRQGMSQLIIIWKQMIMGSSLAANEKKDLLTEMSRVPVELDRISNEQAKEFGDPRKKQESEVEDDE